MHRNQLDITKDVIERALPVTVHNLCHFPGYIQIVVTHPAYPDTKMDLTIESDGTVYAHLPVMDEACLNAAALRKVPFISDTELKWKFHWSLEEYRFYVAMNLNDFIDKAFKEN